jgi:hypothetical protein
VTLFAELERMSLIILGGPDKDSTSGDYVVLFKPSPEITDFRLKSVPFGNDRFYVSIKELE